jgi:hypothetical protein
VYYSILVIIEYAIPLLVMTVAYIKMGRQLWGAKTPGQVRLHNAKIKCFYFSYLGRIFLTPNQRKAVFWPTIQMYIRNQDGPNFTKVLAYIFAGVI